MLIDIPNLLHYIVIIYMLHLQLTFQKMDDQFIPDCYDNRGNCLQQTHHIPFDELVRVPFWTITIHTCTLCWI